MVTRSLCRLRRWVQGRQQPCCRGAEQLSHQGPQSAGDTPWGGEGLHGPGSGTAGCSHTSGAGTRTKPYSEGQESRVITF